jgi:hypothetical protein
VSSTHLRPLQQAGAEAEESEGEAAAQGALEGEHEEHEGDDAGDGVHQPPAEAHEAPAVRAVRDPGQPTRTERAAHELTHLPFRPWCADCVAGKAADDPHRRAAREEDDGPVKVSVDYGFVTERAATEADPERMVQRTILVVKVSGCKAIMAKCVRGKGRADPLAASWLVDQLRRLGLGRCVLQADGEPAQRTFVKDVLEEAARTSAIGVAAAHTPPHDHQCNGGVEKAVRDVKDHVRVMRCALSRHVGPVPVDGAAFEWMVTWAAELLTGGRVGHDGMTAFRRLKGRNWEPRVAEFGEQVQARRPRARLQGDAEPRWDQTTYLGTRWGTAEHWVADADGTARKVRAVRRMSLADRWCPAKVSAITGLPDDPSCRDGGGEPAAMPEAGIVPHPDPLAEPARLRRGFRIEASDLQQHGYTEQCPKCDALRAGRSVGTGHSVACRDRFRAVFLERDDGRVEREAGRREGAPAGLDGAVAADDAAMEEHGERAAEGTLTPLADDDAAMVDAFAAAHWPMPDTPSTIEDDLSEPGDDLPMMNVVRPQRARWEDADGERDDAWTDFVPGATMIAAATAVATATTTAAATATAGRDIELSGDVVVAINNGAQQTLSAKEQVRRICHVSGLSPQASGHVVTELFSPPRVTAKVHDAQNATLAAGTSFDMIVDQHTGESWDFLRADHRRRCWARLRTEDPWVVIGSPPCTAFSVLNRGLNRDRVPAERRERQLAEGKVLLGFALSVYVWQIRRQKYFLHEHPASASSWTLPEVMAVRTMEGVATVINDACVFGMKAVGPDGVERLVKKPTRWMSNAPALLRRLAARCSGCHAHTQLLGGRAAAAAVYPPELVVAIVRGLQAQREEDSRIGDCAPPLSAEILQALACDAPKAHAFKNARVVYDEYTGEPLDADLVRKAMEEELDYFRTKDVWKVVPRAQAAGRRVVGTRWVSCNKGDAEHPEIRCRLVCQEVKTYNSEEFFAATPPIESLRLILSLAADDERRQVTLVDISRAYFNALIARLVHVELPPQAGYSKDLVGQLVKCMYGTRDAAQGWEHTYRQALEEMGFHRGRASPCVFTHAAREIYLTVHGDDFFAAGTAKALDWFEKTLLTRFEGKVKGRLKACGDELRILNRIVRRTGAGYEWEADQRHAELLIAGAGLTEDSRPLSNPGRKLNAKELETEPELLDEAAASDFRARAARANFMACDRPDVAFAVKELCRGMSAPTTRDADALKRLSRYLLGRPRLVLHFAWQTRPALLEVFSDSDWAGCIRTRKSTTGGALMRGRHVLKTWSGTQATIALSSAEAELIAAVRAAAEGLAVRSLVRDFGLDCGLRIHVDSSAAIGICKRTGVGKIRHLDTRLLWIQEGVRDGTFEVIKVLGTENPADLMTKHLGAEQISECLTRLSGWEREGRAQAAPRVKA